MSYQVENPNIRSIFYQDTASSHLKVGKNFDLDLMSKERQRIEKQLKNAGYYRFSREFVVFEADTSRTNKTANLTLNIKNKVDKFQDTDSLVESRHQIYTISKVYVRMNYSAQRMQNRSGDTTQIDDLTFIDLGDYELKKNFLARKKQLQLFGAKNDCFFFGGTSKDKIDDRDKFILKRMKVSYDRYETLLHVVLL